jgi:hypothetical protein
LLQAIVLRLLVLDVFPDHGLITSYGGDEKAPSPKALANEISFPFSVYAGDVDGTLSLNKADHLRHCVFRRDLDQHVHVVRLQMTLLDPAFLLRS